MKAQNPGVSEKLESGSEFSVVFTKEHKNKRDDSPTYQVVARISKDIREALKANSDKVFIGFSSHRVFDRFYVKLCAKCHRFGHYHANCDGTPCCGYCSSENHTSENCPVHGEKDQSQYRCVNCQDAGKNCEGHSSHWNRCPTYIEHQQKVKKNIPYYSKNSQ